jgi:hypothetical protein
MSALLIRLAVAAGAFFFLVLGAWAFIHPRSFFEVVAPWEPFNAHLLRDVGAFSIGLGVGLVAERTPKRHLAMWIGATSGAFAHVLSHVIDRGQGGRPSDPYVLAGVAVLLLAATLAQAKGASE